MFIKSQRPETPRVRSRDYVSEKCCQAKQQTRINFRESQSRVVN